MSLRARYNPINYTNLAGKIDHGLLLGLTDNDHVQYVNAVSDTASIDLTLTGQSISGDIKPAGISHNQLADYNAAEHVIGLTNTYIPYSNSGVLADSPLTTDGTNVSLQGDGTFSTSSLYVASNMQVDGVLVFDDLSTSIFTDTIGELSIGGSVSVNIDTPITTLSGSLTLPDNKYISFGTSGYGTDASIEWDSSGYLDIQSADTRFSGTIAIPATADANTGVIEQPAGQRFIHTYGTDNLFVGYQSGNFTLTGVGNTGIGKLNMPSCLGGSNNSAVGKSALQSLTTGNNNMAIGTFALLSCNTGADNLAIGYAALNDLQDGSENVALGTQAGQTLTARFNVYVGASAGRLNEAARYTVGIGYEACRGNAADGYGNIGIGSKALYSVAGTTSTTGSYNTVMGYEAGYGLTTGNGNIFLGKFAGFTQTTNSDLFIVDNVKRANPTTDASNAILYGVMATTVAGQSLSINADLDHNGDKVGFYGIAPVAKAAALTTQLTTITIDGPSTPDYIYTGSVTNSSPYGLTTADEVETLLSVVRNLQVRVAELETRLASASGVGLFT